MAINSLSASSKGLSGLASGIDTESVVEAMLSSTQSKIDAQNQKKTQLGYKQELYRGVISDLQKFQNTYFSYTNQNSNLLSQGFFSTKSVSTTSSHYTVSATSSAEAGKLTVNSINSLASSYKQSAKNSASAVLAGTISEVKLQAMRDLLNEEALTFSVGEKSAKIILTSLAGKSSLEAEQIINQALVDNGINANVEFVGGSFTLSADNKNASTSITASENALKVLGGSSFAGTGGGTFSLNTSAVLPAISLNIDGVTKSLTFNPFADASGIADQLNSAVASAFGSGLSVTESGGKISFTAANSSRKISITGESNTMAALGIKSGSANKVTLNASLDSNNFATPVLGQNHKFSINGVDFSFTADQTVTAIMTAINNSDAGVTVSYSSTTDKFTIASSATGTRSEAFSITQTQGNLMTALFGIAPAGDTTGSTLTKQVTEGTLPSGAFRYDGGKINLFVNGEAVSLSVDASFNSADSMISVLNETLLTQFGSSEAGVANVSFALSGNKVSLNTVDGYSAYVTDNSLSAFGFDTAVKADTTLADLGMSDGVSFDINGTVINIDATSKISEMVSTINTAFGRDVASFNENKAYIRIAGVDIPMTFVDFSGKLFGQQSGELGVDKTLPAPAAEELFSITQGTNAVLTINDVVIERNSNSFTIDGVSFSLLSETTEASSVTVNQDTDSIYDTVIKFVEDYNTLINSINSLVDADATYKNYPPLTSAQKEDMSETQISLWEKKSKEGLLRNDSSLNDVLASLRRTLYTKPEGSLALYDLGISTSYFGSKDNLLINDPAKLKSLISENPDAIMKLFTDSENGLATLLNDAISNASRTSSVNPGSLVRIAGSAGKSDSSSNIYKQVKEIEGSLNRLETRYQNEYERYWKQFNSMESLISKMNSTSSWLGSMMS